MAIENSKKNLIRKKLEQLIGREVIVYIDRPKGSTHPKHNNIVYPVNYGYIKEIIANDNEYQDAYLLGVDEQVDSYQGIVYAVVERENDVEDKLIVVAKNINYSIEEIKKIIHFQEQYFKYKIIK